MLLVLLVLLVLQILQMLLISFNGCRCIYTELINIYLFWGLSPAAAGRGSKIKNRGHRKRFASLKTFFRELIPADSLPRLDSGQKQHSWSVFLFPAFLQAYHKASAADPDFSAGA